MVSKQVKAPSPITGWIRLSGASKSEDCGTIEAWVRFPQQIADLRGRQGSSEGQVPVASVPVI